MHKHVKDFMRPGGVYTVTIIVPVIDEAYMPIESGYVTTENIEEEFHGLAAYVPRLGKPDLCADGCCLNFTGINTMAGTVLKVTELKAFRATQEEVRHEMTEDIMSAIFRSTGGGSA